MSCFKNQIVNIFKCWTNLSQDLHNCCVQFSAGEDYKNTLIEGPWQIVVRSIAVNQWHPFFKLSDTIVERAYTK